MKRISVLPSVLTLGCAASGVFSNAPVVPTAAEVAALAEASRAAPLPIPEEVRPDVAQAEKMGTMIFMQDQATTLAQAALLANTSPAEQKTVAGSLAQPEANDDGTQKETWLVQCFTSEAEPRIAFRVRVALDGRKPVFERPKPALRPDEHTLRLIRARQTALAAVKGAGSTADQSVHPVVFPVDMGGRKVFVVYLIAGSTRPDVVVFGPHSRVVVSEDGREVVKTARLSGEAQETRLDAAGNKPGGSPSLVVLHKESDLPLETHVFASLLHKRPVYVGTPRRIWAVDGATVSLLRQTKDVAENHPPDRDRVINDLDSVRQIEGM